MRTLVLTSTIALLGLGSTAQAHFNLMSPTPTTADTGGGKGAPPCGPDTAAAATPTAAQGGHTIMLKLQETVRHGGFYRAALSINSRSEIPVDNVVYDAANKILPPSGNPQGMSARADSEATPVFPVLGDNLFMHPMAGPANQVYQMDLMLPNVTCAKCTLQVIEFMAPHTFNPGGGYFYHHCADLKITADPAMPPFSPGADGGVADASTADAKADASTGAAGGGGGAGSSGVAGSVGSAGSGGATGSGGEAGGTVTGGGGSTGSGGSATAGVTGTSSGAAGTGAHRSSGGGGCSLASTGGSQRGWSVFILMFLGACRRNRRSRGSQ